MTAPDYTKGRALIEAATLTQWREELSREADQPDRKPCGKGSDAVLTDLGKQKRQEAQERLAALEALIDAAERALLSEGNGG